MKSIGKKMLFLFVSGMVLIVAFFIIQNAIPYTGIWIIFFEVFSGIILFIGVICFMSVMVTAIPAVFYKPKVLSENEYNEILEVITAELRQIQLQLTFNQKLASEEILAIMTNLKTIENQIELFEIKNEQLDVLLSAIHEKFLHNEVNHQ